MKRHNGLATRRGAGSSVRVPRNLSIPIALAITLALASCVDQAGSEDGFTATGEIIALSGGAAGPRYACVACHGVDGRGNGYDAPALAGKPAGYLQKQLEDYVAGTRQHEAMRYVATRLSPAERGLVATWFAGLPPADHPAIAPDVLYANGDPARGIPSCASCHGASGEGIGQANPPLAGQPAPYIAQQLSQWKNAKRRNDAGDVMLRIAQRLTDQEIAALAGALGHDQRPPASPAR